MTLHGELEPQQKAVTQMRAHPHLHAKRTRGKHRARLRVQPCMRASCSCLHAHPCMLACMRAGHLAASSASTVRKLIAHDVISAVTSLMRSFKQVGTQHASCRALDCSSSVRVHRSRVQRCLCNLGLHKTRGTHSCLQPHHSHVAAIAHHGPVKLRSSSCPATHFTVGALE